MKARLSDDGMGTDLVCLPRPITRSEKPDGGPLVSDSAHGCAVEDRRAPAADNISAGTFACALAVPAG